MLFDEFTYLKPEDSAPELEIETLDREIIRTRDKSILFINFFIIPCRHCHKMLEYLEENIWPDFREKNIRLVSIGRDHTVEELTVLRNNGNYSLPFAADPDRSVYSRFAERKVPRNYLFDAEGRLVHHTRGFDPEQMQTLTFVLANLISRTTDHGRPSPFPK